MIQTWLSSHFFGQNLKKIREKKALKWGAILHYSLVIIPCKLPREKWIPPWPAELFQLPLPWDTLSTPLTSDHPGRILATQASIVSTLPYSNKISIDFCPRSRWLCNSLVWGKEVKTCGHQKRIHTLSSLYEPINNWKIVLSPECETVTGILSFYKFYISMVTWYRTTPGIIFLKLFCRTAISFWVWIFSPRCATVYNVDLGIGFCNGHTWSMKFDTLKQTNELSWLVCGAVSPTRIIYHFCCDGIIFPNLVSLLIFIETLFGVSLVINIYEKDCIW